MEDILPPFVRDSKLFGFMVAAVYPLAREFTLFRQNAHKITPEEYRLLYSKLERIHDTTDNSEAILKEIIKHIVNGRIIDIGCGTGYTLKFLADRLPANSVQFTGVDFQIAPEAPSQSHNISFEEHDICNLPFPDNSFENVLCTHTLEHILDIRLAIAELRRICAKRLIIVVPKEREGLYTFNPHFHFFPYVHSFFRFMLPLPKKYSCYEVGRDIIYIEDKNIN